MAAQRCLDYFLVVGPATPYTATTPLHPSASPARSFIDRTYRASLLFRYPGVDHPHVAFPPGVEMFCVPDDLRLSTVHVMPKHHYFVVTGGAGERLYGSCLRFYEEVDAAAVRLLEREDERLCAQLDRAEEEERERRKKEISVSLSREEEREAELEEEMEKEQAQRLVSFHAKVLEDQQRWREHSQAQAQAAGRCGKPSHAHQQQR